MNHERIAFARALEAVCRQLNPPHLPLPPAVALAELGLEGLKLAADDPLLAYRYLRGLDLPGPAVAASASTRLWAMEPGLVGKPHVLAELAPGVLVVGDHAGFLRLFSRRGRGRWEAAEVLLAHSLGVSALLALSPTEMISAGIDGGLTHWTRDGKGRWQPVALPNGPREGIVTALCLLNNGDLIVANDGMGLFQRQPSGEWIFRASYTDGRVQAMAAYGPDGLLALQAQGLIHWRFGILGANSAPAPWPLPSRPGALLAWPDGSVLIGGENGELTRVAAPVTDQPPPPRDSPQQLTASPIRALRRFGEDGLMSWNDGGQLRLWCWRNQQFERLTELDVEAGPGGPCAAALCDGRIALAERRALVVASPDGSGTWRSDETIAAMEPGVSAVAALGPDRVAYVDGGNRLIVVRIRAEDVEVLTTRNESAPITALVAVNARTLVYQRSDGMLQTLTEGDNDKGWLREVFRDARSGPLPLLAGDGGRLLIAGPGPELEIHDRVHDGWALLPPLAGQPPDPGAVAAVAVSPGQRRVAMAIGGLLYVSDNEQKSWITGSGTAVGPSMGGLAWEDDSHLLAIGPSGSFARITVQPWAEVPQPSVERHLDAAPPFALTAGHGLLIGVDGGLGRPDQHGGLIGCCRSRLRQLSAAGGSVFAAGEALYLFELPPGGKLEQATLRRIVVTPEVALMAWLDPLPDPTPGRITRLVLRRRRNFAWNVSGQSSGLLPEDPLLQSCLGLVAVDGTLAELAAGADFDFDDSRTILRARDPG